MKNLFFLFLALLTLSISSCKENKSENEPELVIVDPNPEIETYEIAKTDAEFNDPNVEAVFNQYLEVQAALVNTDANKVAEVSSKLFVLLEKIQAQTETLENVSNMSKTKDIELQRKIFLPLTNDIEMILNGALKSGTLYKQYCPMAFNNKGAYWISSSKDILNPYFGDKMLKCGRVDSEISVK